MKPRYTNQTSGHKNTSAPTPFDRRKCWSAEIGNVVQLAGAMVSIHWTCSRLHLQQWSAVVGETGVTEVGSNGGQE